MNEWTWGGEYATDESQLHMMPSWYFLYDAPGTITMEYYLQDIAGQGYGYYWTQEENDAEMGAGYTLSYNSKNLSPSSFLTKTSARAVQCLKD